MNKKAFAWIVSAFFALATGMPDVDAQEPDQVSIVFTQEDLDQMLAPIALYPDPLLADVLMAATYPLEVVQTSRFLDSRPGLQGDALAQAIAPMPWDPSVKSLTQFPSVLTMMNDQLDWTQRLGIAFLTQQANVMDTVQQLRMKAQLAGNLASTAQQRIVQQDQFIEIEPANPEVIFVPYYNPTIVYGSWWWPQQPPVYWVPPPRYRPPSYNPLIGTGLFFGAGIGIVQSFYHRARPDWRGHHVWINNRHANNWHSTNNGARPDRPTIWQHQRRNEQTRQRPVTAPNKATDIRPNPTARPAPRPAQPPSGQERDARHRAVRPDRPAEHSHRGRPDRVPQAADMPTPQAAPLAPHAHRTQRPASSPPASGDMRAMRLSPPARSDRMEHHQRPSPPVIRAPSPESAPAQQTQRPVRQERPHSEPRQQPHDEPSSRRDSR